MLRITKGVIESAQRIVVYGPEGIGKSTFLSQFPNAIFIDTEGSTRRLNVQRLPAPSSWSMLIDEVKYVKANLGICRTLALDTADWAEQLCMAEVCAKAQKSGIEEFGYGKGYVYVAEEFGRLLNLLTEVNAQGVHIAVSGHAKMRKFEQPDEMGAYDRWELKLSKLVAPMLKEWADMVLFANYKTYVVNIDGQGAEKGKNKAQGGARVMYTSHHPCWDAKNRHSLNAELKFEFSEISHCLSNGPELSVPVEDVEDQEEDQRPEEDNVHLQAEPDATKNNQTTKIPKALQDLMNENGVLEYEIQTVVADRGYYPENTPIENYDPQFISGVLVAAWPQVFQMVLNEREKMPF